MFAAHDFHVAVIGRESPVRSCCARVRTSLIARQNVVETEDAVSELADEDLEEVLSDVEEVCPVPGRSASPCWSSVFLIAPGGGSSRMADLVGFNLYDPVQP